MKDLEAQVSLLPNKSDQDAGAELLVRGAGLVKLKESGEEARFLGPSSGIAMTRLILVLAKDLYNTKSIKEIVPEKKAQEIRTRCAEEALKPTSKVYPLISSVAAPFVDPAQLLLLPK